jgi:hypothetical protein
LNLEWSTWWIFFDELGAIQSLVFHQIIPLEPGFIFYGAMLCACKFYKNVELAEELP